MVLLALLLLTVGVSDVLRHTAISRTAPLAASVLASVVTPLLCAYGLALDVSDWWAVPAVIVATICWLVVPDLAHRRARTAAMSGLGVAVLGALALGHHISPGRGSFVRWYDSLEIRALDGVVFERFALAVGCLIFLHSSANVIVRLVLAGSGPHVLESEKTLKGGRILGPIERWFIFAMALAGQFGAIAAVVAAKGIVRFPEISRSDSSGYKAEYVLVGSFVSWFLALLFVPLLK